MIYENNRVNINNMCENLLNELVILIKYVFSLDDNFELKET